MEKRKISFPVPVQNQTPVVQHGVGTLYWQSYPGSSKTDCPDNSHTAYKGDYLTMCPLLQSALPHAASPCHAQLLHTSRCCVYSFPILPAYLSSCLLPTQLQAQKHACQSASLTGSLLPIQPPACMHDYRPASMHNHPSARLQVYVPDCPPTWPLARLLTCPNTYQCAWPHNCLPTHLQAYKPAFLPPCKPPHAPTCLPANLPMRLHNCLHAWPATCKLARLPAFLPNPHQACLFAQLQDSNAPACMPESSLQAYLSSYSSIHSPICTHIL